MAKYSVAPFSGTKWQDGTAHNGAGEPCAICGRPILNPAKAHPAIVIGGGAAWGDQSSPEDGGHMGGWLVGPDCHKRHIIREER